MNRGRQLEAPLDFGMVANIHLNTRSRLPGRSLKSPKGGDPIQCVVDPFPLL